MTLIKEKKTAQKTSKYQAIDKLTSESRDLRAYQGIEDWSKHLCELFDKSVLPFSSSIEFPLNAEIEVMVNNYTFMLVFRGESLESQKALKKVIQFWIMRYQQTENSNYLLKTLQPSINLSRLFLMSGNYDAFWRVINELSPENNRGDIILGGIRICSTLIATHLRFIKYASFKETLKAYLKLKNYQKILDLEKLLPTELCKTIYFREAQIISLFYLGKFDTAESIIRGVMFKTGGVEQNIFYYRLYESYMCQNRLQEALGILNDIKTELSLEPLNNLKDLMFASTVIKESRLLPNDELSEKVLLGYRILRDEMNYANLLLWFHKNNKTKKVENHLRIIHQKTHYKFLSRSIGAELGLNESLKKSPWNNVLTDRFNTFFRSQ